MVAPGEMAPDFTLLTNTGKTVSLSDFKGKNIVLYFYPKDLTPGCTTQACDFRDEHTSFEDAETVVLGVSPDPLTRHQKFIDTHQLPFLLLSDEDHQVSEKYGVWTLKKNFGKEYMGVERSTFLIDKEGKLVKEWRKVKVKGHVQEVLTYIKETT